MGGTGSVSRFTLLRRVTCGNHWGEASPKPAIAGENLAMRTVSIFSSYKQENQFTNGLVSLLELSQKGQPAFH